MISPPWKTGTTISLPGELIDIGHNLRCRFLPSRATYSPTLLDASASHRTLERTKHELGAFHSIETCPPETEGFVKHRRHIRHIGNEVWLVLDDCLYLRQERFVTLLFRLTLYD